MQADGPIEGTLRHAELLGNEDVCLCETLWPSSVDFPRGWMARSP